jgi:integrase
VNQITDSVKTEASHRTMPVSDGLLDILKQWKQVSRFTDSEDWLFASPWKHGRQPIGYTYIWKSLDAASRKAGFRTLAVTRCAMHSEVGLMHWECP